MQYLSIKISDFLMKTGIEIDDKELFEYGIRVILRNFSIFIISFVISFALDFTLPFIIFNTVLVSLRQLTGGYHAKNSTACFIESMILILVVPYIMNVMKSSIQYILFFSIIISCLLYKFTYKKNKRMTIFFFLVVLNILILIFDQKNYLISEYIYIAMFTDLIFLLLPLLQKNWKAIFFSKY